MKEEKFLLQPFYFSSRNTRGISQGHVCKRVPLDHGRIARGFKVTEYAPLKGYRLDRGRIARGFKVTEYAFPKRVPLDRGHSPAAWFMLTGQFSMTILVITGWSSGSIVPLESIGFASFAIFSATSMPSVT